MPADTPPKLRGERYPTHLTQRCAAFYKCSYCSMCINYDKNSAMCTYCEGRKLNPQMHHCTCGNKRNVIRTLEKHFGKSLHDVHLDPSGEGINVAEESATSSLMEQVHKEFSDVGVKYVDMHDRDDSTIVIGE